MKEKLKMVKLALREWHQNHTYNIPSKISNMKERISVLDEKWEVSSLGTEEVEELHGLSEELHSLSRIHSSISWQQSRLNWLREGGSNFKFFHGTLSSRRRVNTISVINVGGVMIEGVSNVREAVFNHFADHFSAPVVERPRPLDLNFRLLSYREGADLVKPFTLDEIKIAVL
jgi:hypothetical protein